MIEQINNIAEGWWDWMWPMFWQVSALIVFIGAVDILLRKRVWPQVRYALWMLVLVKLILPPTFSLSTGVVSQVRILASQTATELDAANAPVDFPSFGSGSEMTTYAIDMGIEPFPIPDDIMGQETAEPLEQAFSRNVVQSMALRE